MAIFYSLEHSNWTCKYHVVFIPKNRKKTLYGNIKLFLRDTLHELAKQKGCLIISGKIMKDHIHILISIPPKLAVSTVIGFLKGKSAIAIARNFSGIKRNFNGERFWARGYSVSTVGYEEAKVREYIKNQEELDSLSGEF